MNVELLVRYMHRGEGEAFTPGTVVSMDTHEADRLCALHLARPAMRQADVELPSAPAEPGRGWADLRKRLKVQPYDYRLVYHDKRSLLNIRPGESILITRKYGGLGDILIVSCLINELLKRYPENPLTLATPKRYHELFRRVRGLSLLDWEAVHEASTEVRGGVIKNEVAEQYEVAEDVSTPCHLIEGVYKYFGGYDGPIIPQNRLEMWGNWIGVYDIDAPETCIHLTGGEIARAKTQYKLPENLAIIAPVSALDAKNYYDWPELARALEAYGLNVVILGDKRKLDVRSWPIIQAAGPRDFLAVVANAAVVVSVDSAALHAAGIQRVPGVGLFNVNDGPAYCKFYPSVVPVDLCAKDSPCILSRVHECQRKHPRTGHPTCYPADIAGEIAKTVYGVVSGVGKTGQNGAPLRLKGRGRILPKGGNGKRPISHLNESGGSMAGKRIIRLNLGCGMKFETGPEWLNVDVRKLYPGDALFWRRDLRKLDGFIKPGVVAEIKMDDVLEHFAKPEAESVLRQVVDLLEPGGRLVIKTPAIGLLIRWAKTHDEASTALRWYGGQDYPENVHKYVWPCAALESFLVELGLRVLSVDVVEDTNVFIVAEKPAEGV